MASDKTLFVAVNKYNSRENAVAVMRHLAQIYPSDRTELIYKNHFELIVAVVLSAQCTDVRVNLTTPALFKKYPTAQKLAKAKPADVEKLIHSCGFYRNKTKSIISLSQDLVEKYGGSVPDTLEELVSLAGVGRKTASVVLNQAFDKPAIAVDTHVNRLSNRLGWVNNKDPVKVEMALRELVPQKYWAPINGLLILHGRRICSSRKPKCDQCTINKYCAYFNNT